MLLTQGDRRDALRRAIVSARDLRATRRYPDVEVVVVWNGAGAPVTSQADVDVALPENVGIPEGRNRGAERCTGDIVIFLDDDAYFDPGQSLANVLAPFDDEATAVVAFRIADDAGRTARRHVPRLGGRRPLVGGEVTAFLGGAAAVRRDVFLEVGGYPGEFFYSMEETDLALRVVDAGYRIVYHPAVLVRHPWTQPTRHADSLTRTARNRVWLAHRDLPMPIAIAYVVIWLAISSARNLGSAAALRSIVSGTWEGLRGPLGPRSPIRWSTAWRLTRLGRPPVI